MRGGVGGQELSAEIKNDDIDRMTLFSHNAFKIH